MPRRNVHPDVILGITQREECESALAYGYPYGFGGNLTVFTGASEKSVAKTAVENWVNSLDHFQSMIDPSGDCLGVGVERMTE